MLTERIAFYLEIVLFLKVSNGEHQLIVGTFRNDWLAAGACRPYTLPTIQKGRAKRGYAALESAAKEFESPETMEAKNQWLAGNSNRGLNKQNHPKVTNFRQKNE